MDKYEFNIKIEKMKKAVDRKDYVTAAKVADSLNWERSTNAKVLMMIAQIYEKQERYAEARNALTEVYSRVPVGKRIVYKLTELAVLCGDLDDALDLYREYQEIAPNDPNKLILAYKISTARGDDLDKRISILEAYRRRDFDEKWAYELATLYQQAGRGTDCVAICDEIILWFGVGPYVDRAMTLKVAYEPLTPEQEEKRAHKDYYEQKLAEVAALSAVVPVEDADSEGSEYFEENEPAEAPADEDTSTAEHSDDPAAKEAALHMTLQQELAQAIQSTTGDLTPEEDTNNWITDQPISVDRVGEDVDGQYTLFRTVAEENGEVRGVENTRTFSFGALLSKTRRLDSLRDLAELNNHATEEKPATPETEVEKSAEAGSAVTETSVTESETVEPEINEPKVDESDATEPEIAESSVAEPEMAEPAAEEPEHTQEDPNAEETSATESVEAETDEDEITDPDALVDEFFSDDIPAKPRHKVFCHILELDEDIPAIKQIKDSFREAHQISGLPEASIARIAVEKVNRAGFSAVLGKLQGRDLLLEHAGELDEDVLEEILDVVVDSPCNAVILLADNAAGIAELHEKAPALFPQPADEDIDEFDFEEALLDFDAEPDEHDSDEADSDEHDSDEDDSGEHNSDKHDFDEDDSDEHDLDEDDSDEHDFDDDSEEDPYPAYHDLEPLTPDKFSEFIYEYALENDCKFDSMAELALAALIDRMELSGAPMNMETAVDLVERAIDKAERFTFKSIFVSRYDKEGYLIIKETHIS